MISLPEEFGENLNPHFICTPEKGGKKSSCELNAKFKENECAKLLLKSV